MIQSMINIFRDNDFLPVREKQSNSLFVRINHARNKREDEFRIALVYIRSFTRIAGSLIICYVISRMDQKD